MLNPIAVLILMVLSIYKWVVIAAVILSWLIAFNVINTYNNFVRSLVTAVGAVTEPVFRQVRRVIPPFGGLDLSPLVVLVLIQTLQYAMSQWEPLVRLGW